MKQELNKIPAAKKTRNNINTNKLFPIFKSDHNEYKCKETTKHLYRRPAASPHVTRAFTMLIF